MNEFGGDWSKGSNEKYCIPQNPRVDGYHWVEIKGNFLVVRWFPPEDGQPDTWGAWQTSGILYRYECWIYHGPCLRPDEMKDMVEKSKKEGQKEAFTEASKIAMDAAIRWSGYDYDRYSTLLKVSNLILKEIDYV